MPPGWSFVSSGTAEFIWWSFFVVFSASVCVGGNSLWYDGMSERRVVVTGYGVQSCVGCDVPSFWDALVNGRCGLGPVTFFDATEYRTRIAGEIKDFDPEKYMSVKEAKRVDRF